MLNTPLYPFLLFNMSNQSDVVEPEADVANKSNVVNTRLNKLLETRFENDKVSDIIQLLIIYVFLLHFSSLNLIVYMVNHYNSTIKV